MTDKLSTIEQHFRPEESEFIQQVSEWIRQSEDEYRGILTKFLNPREQYILQTLVNRVEDLTVTYNGGTIGAENQRAIIAPDFYQFNLSDFELALLEVKYPVKFVELHHSTLLGSLMNAGITRDVIGDILFDDSQQWQIIVDAKMVPYLQQTIEKVGHVKITLSVADFSHVIQKHDDWEEIFLLSSSLRVDTVIAAAFAISRSLAKSLVEQRRVRINWTVIDKPDFMISVGDIVSVRKYGRLQLTLLDGFSKKDKIKTVVNIIRR
ncbi:MAG: RNA-binding protein [Leuconostoc carnosum]|uniref:YlmH family RNA-binding protein n=1 Tax=Leuconostoc carnosum TaxID=1252 RepID=UPI003F995B36